MHLFSSSRILQSQKWTRSNLNSANYRRFSAALGRSTLRVTRVGHECSSKVSFTGKPHRETVWKTISNSAIAISQIRVVFRKKKGAQKNSASRIEIFEKKKPRQNRASLDRHDHKKKAEYCSNGQSFQIHPITDDFMVMWLNYHSKTTSDASASTFELI